jgi:hypothetical protein
MKEGFFYGPLIIFRPTRDAPSSSLMDSATSLKKKTVEGEGVGARSLAHSISGGRGACWSSGMGLGRLTSKSLTHMDPHKPNNRLVSV